jgi:hypothetical protein
LLQVFLAGGGGHVFVVRDDWKFGDASVSGDDVNLVATAGGLPRNRLYVVPRRIHKEKGAGRVGLVAGETQGIQGVCIVDYMIQPHAVVLFSTKYSISSDIPVRNMKSVVIPQYKTFSQ